MLGRSLEQMKPSVFHFQALDAVQIYSSSCVPCTLLFAPSTFSMSLSSPARACASGRSTAVSRWWSDITTAGLTAWPAASCRCMTVESASHLRLSSKQKDLVYSSFCVIVTDMTDENYNGAQRLDKRTSASGCIKN